MMRVVSFFLLSVLLQSSYAFAPMQVIAGTDTFGNNSLKVKIPGYFSTVLTDGEREGAGMTHFFDLKNDSAEKQDMGGGYGNYQWQFQNNTHYEHCPSSGEISVLESNNVRTVLLYKYSPRPFGSDGSTVDSNVIIKNTFVMYRPDKMYQAYKYSVRYTADTLHYFNCPMSISWIRFTGDDYSYIYWNSAAHGDSYTPYMPSPWTFTWEAANEDYRGPDYLGNHYILYAATPGFTTYHLTGDTVRVKANWLHLMKNERGAYSHQGQLFVGLRTEMGVWGGTVIQPGTSKTLYTLSLRGDNNITCRDSANTYIAEYCSSAVPVMVKGSTTGMDSLYGSYEMTAASDSASYTLTGMLHYPAFNIRSWNKGVPATIKVNSIALVRDIDYIGITDSGRLLIQVMKVYKGSPTTQFEIFGDNTPTATKPAPQKGYALGLTVSRSTAANGNITVQYQIPQNGYTSLRVYDFSGRLIRTIVGANNHSPLRPGSYQTQWNLPNGIRNGLYLFVLENGDKRISRIVPVIK